MSRRYRLDELKGFELWLLRTAILLFFFVFVCLDAVALYRGEIGIRGQSAPVYRASEPIRYWFFTGVTLLPAIIAGTGFVWTFTPSGKPRKRRAR